MTNRYKVLAGENRKYEIGDKIGQGNAVVTGFGKIWTETPTDDTACAWGLEPGLDYYNPVSVQYAYCTDD